MLDIKTGAETEITVLHDGKSTTCKLYSEQGIELLATLWLKVAAQFRLMYEPTWLGIPIVQLPSDILMIQELIWKVRPDVIVECGIAHGGSLVLYSSLCELIGHGSVIGVDVEIRKYNRAAVTSHPTAGRISLIEGSSTDLRTFSEVKRLCAGAQRVLVILDSNHEADHVAEEMRLYHELVTPGSYLVVMDGAAAFVWDVPRGQSQYRDNHPLVAVRQFLKDHAEFEIDPHYNRLHITSTPDGFLRRRSIKDLKSEFSKA